MSVKNKIAGSGDDILSNAQSISRMLTMMVAGDMEVKNEFLNIDDASRIQCQVECLAAIAICVREAHSQLDATIILLSLERMGAITLNDQGMYRSFMEIVGKQNKETT